MWIPRYCNFFVSQGTNIIREATKKPCRNEELSYPPSFIFFGYLTISSSGGSLLHTLHCPISLLVHIIANPHTSFSLSYPSASVTRFILPNLRPFFSVYTSAPQSHTSSLLDLGDEAGRIRSCQGHCSARRKKPLRPCFRNRY